MILIVDVNIIPKIRVQSLKKNLSRETSNFLLYLNSDLEHVLQSDWFGSIGDVCIESFVREMQDSECKKPIFPNGRKKHYS